eukprot:scaffold216588_cov47-Prasinocladus_malaysianus.AAC.2
MPGTANHNSKAKAYITLIYFRGMDAAWLAQDAVWPGAETAPHELQQHLGGRGASPNTSRCACQAHQQRTHWERELRAQSAPPGQAQLTTAQGQTPPVTVLEPKAARAENLQQLTVPPRKKQVEDPTDMAPEIIKSMNDREALKQAGSISMLAT